MSNDVPSLDQLRLRLAGLIEPLPGPDPAGISLRSAPEIDVLREARREDDASLPTGVWQADLKRADWSTVENLASELLSKSSKDLLVATWLGEAWLQRYQLPGLCVALELVDGLCERYGLALYPRGDDASWLASPLGLLVRQYSLLLNIRLPLLGAAARGFESLTLEQWTRAQKQLLNKSEERKAKALAQESHDLLRDWREAVLRVPVSELDARLQLLNACSQSVERLNDWGNRQLGDEAPSFAALQNILDLHVQALREFIAMHPEPLPVFVPDILPAEPATTEEPVLTTAALPLSAPESRQAAYRQLKVISDYLKRVEPHSPVPYLINRAVDWGNMELPELLGELIKADPDIQRIWRLLGVLP
ncbi:type VI secretion system protein TssA [Pseudomonas gingeri]|uniref:type VI secretion system protein TssA n=1 Tax=Pseudomonas gingeri TaxID=117681 RepID=UPI00159FC02B|nr:type VI secretion system protein TssA [Pseudomonas gingeri]NWD71832.1 type VI secretion system protein TssA [Pseudomonas gingeri]